jgi:hypothetical protein
MNTALVARIEDQPSTVVLMDQPGVNYERVDSSTRHIIHALFPVHTRGETFFLSLLEHATIKPDVLLCKPKEVRGDAAVVSVLGCAELSQLIHLSFDTTQKYLAIYRILGLLSYVKQGKCATITIPLTAPQSPDELAKRLRQLRECYLHKRPKLLSLIDNMIERISSLTQADQADKERLPVAEQGYPLSNSMELLAPIQRVLFSEGVMDLGGHIATRILEVFARATMASNGKDMQFASSFTSENLPPQLENVSGVDSAVYEPTQHTVPVSSLGRFLMGNLPTRCQGGDRELVTDSTSTKCSRSLVSNLPSNQQTSEEIEPDSTEGGRFVISNLIATRETERASHAAFEPAGLNLPGRVDSEKISPLNGNGNGDKYINNNTNYLSDPVPVLQASTSEVEQLTLNVSLPIAHPTIRHQALALARLIEGNEENVGAYVKLLRKYDLQAIKAGVIATLQRKHFPEGRKALRAPGGYFTKQVQRYQDALTEQMVEMLETYAQATYEEIDVALEKHAQVQAEHLQTEVLGLSQAVSRTKQEQPMDERVATKLAERIAAENPYVQFKGTRKMQDGSYTVKVYIDPVEYDFCSIEAWEIYHAQLQALEQEVS